MDKMQATLILLSGGQSKRMGQPKHLLPTPHGRLIDYLHVRLFPLFTESLLVGRDISVPESEWRVVEDLLPVQGALVGIYSGLMASGTDLCFVLACDMPFVVPELVSYLLSLSSGVDAVVPIVRGYYEPLCAVYRRTAIPAIISALERAELRVTGIYDRLRVRTVDAPELRRFDPDLSSFINLNTPHQLHLLSRLP